MKFGVALPSCYEGLIFPPPFGTPESILRIGLAAEALGYDSVMPNDHFTTQAYVRAMLPDPPNFFDPFICLSWVASATNRIELITGIAVLPIRDPVVLAKQAASLDVFSGGRLKLGVGAGAYREEFEAVAPGRAAAKRGELLDEGIAALRMLFTQRRATYEGKHVRFHDVEMFPKPVQTPFPIWSGGNSRQVIERAARHCQGWLPAVLSPAEIASGVRRIRNLGGDVARTEIAPQLIACLGRDLAEASARLEASHAFKHLKSLSNSTLKNQQDNLEARNLVGDVDEICRRVEAYQQAGVTHLPGLIFAVNDIAEFISQMELFASQVISRFRS